MYNIFCIGKYQHFRGINIGKCILIHIQFVYSERTDDYGTNNIKYFRKARGAALISDFDKTHVGCIAVYHDTVISAGWNSHKTHPMQKYYNKFRPLDGGISNPMPKLHAEMMCITELQKMDIDFSKVHLYIYRIRNAVPFGMTRPCAACMKAIKDLGIKHIHYTTDDGYAYEKLVS